MKKTLSSILLLSSFVFTFSQESLRDEVAIVRPIYTEASVKFLNDFSLYLSRNGYKTSAKLLKSYAEGGFGSGFTYVDKKTGKAYVVTNRHVVAQANTATIEFNTGQGVNRYKECPVALADEQVDLALIELPADAAKTISGFTILTKAPADAAEVFSAGYPGLGSEPSWQIANGIISNNSVFDNSLTGSDSIGVIQHTAAVDAGSSGGPLLVRNPASKKGFDVAGVIAWKAQERENANFAISSKSLNLFIAKYEQNKEQAFTETGLKKQAELFASAVNAGYKQVLPFISSDYVANISIANFYDLMNAISEKARKEVVQCFNSGRPLEGVRIALADAACIKFSKRNLVFSSIDAQSKPAQVVFAFGEKNIPTEWIQEQGYWHIKQIESLKANTLEKDGISTSFGYNNSFKLHVNLPMTENYGAQYAVSFTRTYRTFITSGFGLGIGQLTNLEKRGDNFNASTQTFDTVTFNQNYFFMTYEAGGQLPVKIASVYLIPNAKGLFNVNFGEYVFGSNYGFSAGLDVAYKISRNTYLMGGLSFIRKYRLTGRDADELYNKYLEKGEKKQGIQPSYSMLGLHAGISW
jgi:serine protease Do